MTRYPNHARTSAIALTLSLLFGPTGFSGVEPQEMAYPLGKVDFPVTCSGEAQTEFNRAVGLLHHMTYPQARFAFERVAELDPKCAMAYWGVAMTLFQPLWPNRPGPKELREGWNALEKAKALDPPTERERLFVSAVEAFFREPESTDYWGRIRRWDRAMEIAYGKFPHDPEVRAFFALALLANAQQSADPRAIHNRAAEILLSIHRENPIHPGAVHYLIHANDIRGREHESLEIVRGYGDIAPRNPHALHMPTHIFTRLGSWAEVIAWNRKAAEAALEHPAGDHGQYVWDEFPHAIEYLVYAYLQQADDKAAAAQMDRLISTKDLQPTFKTAFNLSSIPARFALERRKWREAADLTPRPYDDLKWDRYPWPEAVTWFAKGLAAAHLNRVDDTRKADHRLQELEGVAEASGEKLFAGQIRILRLAVEAWVAQAQGKAETALELMREAAELEASTPKHPVTPAQTLPADELLGDLLMELGKPDRALSAFKRSLQLYPNRFNGLLGAARAARALKDAEAARRFYAQLLKVSSSESSRDGVREAREYVADH